MAIWSFNVNHPPNNKVAVKPHKIAIRIRGVNAADKRIASRFASRYSVLNLSTRWYSRSSAVKDWIVENLRIDSRLKIREENKKGVVKSFNKAKVKKLRTREKPNPVTKNWILEIIILKRVILAFYGFYVG